MVAKEYSWVHARCHIAISVVLLALRELFVQYSLEGSYQSLSEVATTESLPGCLAVFSYLHGIEDEADVL